jgi:hypothetical protein
MESVLGAGRSRGQASVFSSPSDVKSVFKAVTRSSSKSYNIKDETSSKYLFSPYFIMIEIVH